MADKYEVQREKLEDHAKKLHAIRDDFTEKLNVVAMNHRINLSGDQFTFAASGTVNAYNKEKDFLLLSLREVSEIIEEIRVGVKVAARNYNEVESIIEKALILFEQQLGALERRRSLPPGVLPENDPMRP